MNKLFIINILFYVSPYLAMILHDMSRHIPKIIREGMLLLYLGFVGFVCMYAFPVNKWLIYKFIPSYLLFFYVASWGGVCCIIMAQRSLFKTINPVKAITMSFLIIYTASFFWEVPENLYWLIKRGWHSAVLLHILGTFPYIWLDGRRKWKKTKENLSLIVLAWGTTVLGLLLFQSSMGMVYDPSSWSPGLSPIVWYFLGCRVVAVFVLTVLFVWGSLRDFYNWVCLMFVFVKLFWETIKFGRGLREW